MKVPFSILAVAATGAALALPTAVLAQEQAVADQAQQGAADPYDCLFPSAPCSNPQPDARGEGPGLQVGEIRAGGGAYDPLKPRPVPAVAPKPVRLDGPKPKPKPIRGEPGRRKADPAVVVAPEAVAKRANVFVTFRSGSAEIETGVPSTIGKLAELMKVEIAAGGKPFVQIDGHTDAVGDEAYNLKLSEARAQTVRDKLVELGVPAEFVKSVGYGESKPIEGYAPTHGINRRVEVVVLK
jgi:outer membrane protein OmpA-like peptidoglycan-associated protein